MIRNEYLRFMQTLTADNVPEGVRKMANLVLEHLDTIQPLGTHQGQRVRRIVRLAHDHWDALVADINVEVINADEVVAPISRLKSLQVGPFRGFVRQENFDLDSPLVLIYGPNGTGKSSFCEALEYGLLGNVAEAESKRFRQQDYLTNAHVGQFTSPVLEAFDLQGEPVPIVVSETQYRFCFVEKNRIDNFSRIAAQLPARQTELISTLFGLDSFNEFVQNFTSEIDGRYIDLVGVKNLQLQQKQKVLEWSKQTITGNAEALIALSEQEAALAKRYKESFTFADMVDALGREETLGEIATLENELQQALPPKTGLAIQVLIENQKLAEETYLALTANLKELTDSSTGLSFKQLYTAVIDLNDVSKEHCPACKTPLDQVASNPFDLANQELQKLGHLSQLEQERDQLNYKLLDIFKSIYQILKIVMQQIGIEEQPNPLAKYSVENELQLNWEWWQSLHYVEKDRTAAWQELQNQVRELEQRDIETNKANEERAKKQERLNQLRQFERKAISIQGKRKTLEEAVEKAKTIIATFDEENKALIAEVEAEKAVVVANQEIATSYSRFVARLEQYRNGLPEKLIADLGDTVVELYNAINRNDAAKDLLAGIKLPLSQGQQIEIAFQTDPEKYFDALHILSEGHIRCIGLAVLMAKNLRENCPILIFDDPVNAIDDEHRESIRKTLFEDNYFENKQIILTCQGEEFFKDIQNLLSAERASRSRNLTFLPQLDEQHIRIDFDCAPRNYILAAQGHMDNLEVREALTKARQALESLTKGKLWRYVNNHGDGNLSIKMRSATAPIELRNLTEQLKGKLLKPDFTHLQKEAILTPIEALLGIGGDSREWRYLNKGTHDEADRAEFDRSIVGAIITALYETDAVI